MALRVKEEFVMVPSIKAEQLGGGTTATGVE
jgi:hypothetical protein